MPKPAHCYKEAYDLFRAQMGVIETPRGLLMAAVAIAMHEMREVVPEQIENTIAACAHTVRARVRSGNPEALLAHLHDYLFDECGFVGNAEDYYNARNSYVPAVLASRRGLPITLSLIYKVVAEHIGLKVVGINAPLHFLTGVYVDDKVLLIDPFFAGRALSREEAFRRIEQMAGRSVPRVDEMLPVATHRQWIGRIIQNLLHVFEHNQREREHHAMMELRGVLMTE